jgi:hypothetical protein
MVSTLDPRHDIIRDLIRRIQTAEEAGQRRLDAELARQVELEARAAWGGCKVHVPVRPLRDERASRVQRAYLEGQRLADIARQEGVTTRTVLNIVRRG